MKNEVQIQGTTVLTNTLFFTPFTAELAAVTLRLWLCSYLEGILAIKINTRN